MDVQDEALLLEESEDLHLREAALRRHLEAARVRSRELEDKVADIMKENELPLRAFDLY